jgi:hypothetical protein
VAMAILNSLYISIFGVFRTPQMAKNGKHR